MLRRFGDHAECGCGDLWRGVDVITTGDHLWDQKEVMLLLDKEPRFLRPANYPRGRRGRGACLLPGRPASRGVLNLQGRVYMPELDNPFACARSEVARLQGRHP